MSAGCFLKYSIKCIFLGLLLGCGNSTDKDPAEKKEPAVILRRDTATAKESVTAPAPIINISDSVAPKLKMIFIKDSSSTSLGLSQKLMQIYSVKLQEVARTNKLKISGPPVAWYKTQKAPYFFEAGLPVDKKPAKMPKGVQYREMGGDSALIAHFYGPYDQTFIAYQALQDWLKDRNKKLKRASYEVYVSDPVDKAGKPVDPYKVQTDIVFPYN